MQFNHVLSNFSAISVFAETAIFSGTSLWVHRYQYYYYLQRSTIEIMPACFDHVYPPFWPPPEPYRTSKSKNYVNSGHGWVPLCNKRYQYRSRKYLFLGAQHGMFVNFGAHFLKRVHPYESKNIIPQPFHLKGPWV